MISTLLSTGQLNAPLGFAASTAVGFSFGLCLEKAGLGSSRRLSGMLRLTDMTLLKVLFSALVTAVLGLVAAERMGLVGLDSLALPPTILAAQALGGAVLGLALAMGGWTPSTAVVGAGAGRLDALVFLAGVALGTIGFGEAYRWMAPLASLGAKGTLFLNQLLGATQDQVVLCLTGSAVLAFWLCEVAERGPAIARPGVGRLFLAVFSALLCLASLVALNVPHVEIPQGQPVVSAAMPPAQAPGAGQPESAQGATAQAGLPAEVRNAIEPQALADRLMAHDPTLTLVDIRPKAEFDAFHLHGATNVPVSGLPELVASRSGQNLVVLCANDETTEARAQDSLARLGFGNISILSGGLEGFFEKALKPESLRAEPFDQAKAARVKAARQFFLPAEWVKPQAPGLLTPPGQLPGLADTAWLASNLGKSGLKVLDLRPQPQYNAGHIPGSLSLDPQNLRGDVGGVGSMLMPRDVLAAHFGLMGVTPRDLVVLVSGGPPQDATLVAMALERLGHSRYVLLNGGMKAWTAANLPTDRALPTVTPVRYPAGSAGVAGTPATPGLPAAPDGFTVSGLDVLAAMTGGRTVIIDARPADAYAGTMPGDPRPGHIPGSVNRPIGEDQEKGPGDSVMLKPVADLEKAYAALIPAKDHPVIVYCNTGHQASQAWWILTRLLGYTNVKYYDASWTEWSAHPEWPVVATPAPAKEKKP